MVFDHTYHLIFNLQLSDIVVGQYGVLMFLFLSYQTQLLLLV